MVKAGVCKTLIVGSIPTVASNLIAEAAQGRPGAARLIAAWRIIDDVRAGRVSRPPRPYLCRGGGTGRRGGLKMRFRLRRTVGSIPTPATIFASKFGGSRR